MVKLEPICIVFELSTPISTEVIAAVLLQTPAAWSNSPKPK
jgi:hypothetical protein